MPTDADRRFSAAIRVNGRSDDDFYRCINAITVEEDLELGSSFEVDINLCRNDDGSWPHLEDENLQEWNRITIIAVFPDYEDVIMDGYISHLQSSANDHTGQAALKIKGVDASYKMNLEEKCRVWSGKTSEQIAQEIFCSYGFTPEVEQVTESGGDDQSQLPSVSQRGTDHQFLRELARRKGYEFFVRGGEGHFHIARLTGTSQKVIAIAFGEQTNCSNMQFETDGTLPTVAIMNRIDPVSGLRDEPAVAESSGLEPLGDTTLSQRRGSEGVPQTRVVVRNQGALSYAQMQDYVTGVLRRNAWWVKVRGTLNGLQYGRILRSKKLVTIKGLGNTYNGVYYVRKVRHSLASRSYTMEFEAHRNAVGQTGAEDYTGESPDAMQSPAAAGSGADTDVVRVRIDGPQVAPETPPSC